MWALSRTDEAQVVEPLVAALSDSKEEVRQAAAKALESARYDLKRTALNLLGESDSLEAIELLITHLIEKPNKVRTIGVLKPPDSAQKACLRVKKASFKAKIAPSK